MSDPNTEWFNGFGGEINTEVGIKLIQLISDPVLGLLKWKADTYKDMPATNYLRSEAARLIRNRQSLAGGYVPREVIQHLAVSLVEYLEQNKS